jgi:hypothetical protein
MKTNQERLRIELDKLGLDYDLDRIAWDFEEEGRDPEGAEVEQWIKCASNVIHFINNYCYIQDPVHGRVPFLLYAFQKTVLKLFLRNVFNICLKPRQMGLSWLIAAFALWYAMFRPEKTVVVISIKEETSKRFMDKIKYMYRHLPAWLKGSTAATWNTSTLKFANNSLIMSVPTSEEAGRSEALSLLIIDEAAFVRWIEKIWAASFSTLSTGGQAILVSTANGLGNFFANKWRDALTGASDFCAIKLHWRMHPKRDDNWYRIQRRELGPALCAQEVDCDFLNSGRPVFDSAIIVEWAEILRLRKPLKKLYTNEQFEDEEGLYGKRAEGLYIYKKPVEGKFYIIGGDCASGDGSDFHALQVIDWETGEQVAEGRFHCKPNIFAAYMFAIGKLYNWAQLVPERNGVGLAVVQKLIEKQYPNLYTYVKEEAKVDEEISTKRLVSDDTLMVGFTTTPANRPVLITLGEELIREHQELRGSSVPEGQLIVNGLRTLNEMLVFNYQETGKPNPRANDGYNDDLVMAWFIAVLARARFKPRMQMPVLFS